MKILLLFLLLFMASSASGEIYRWRDGAGVSHFSNSLDDVPLRYREKVKVMNYGPVQKGDAVQTQVAPSAVKSPATGIPSPTGRSNVPASEGSMLKRKRRGAGRSTEEMPND